MKATTECNLHIKTTMECNLLKIVHLMFQVCPNLPNDSRNKSGKVEMCISRLSQLTLWLVSG